jgi:hypothetical protein
MNLTASASGVARVGSSGGATSTGGAGSQFFAPSQTRFVPQLVPTGEGMWVIKAVAGSQTPEVQGSPSSGIHVSDPTQVAAAVQLSLLVQGLLSLQTAPTAA